MTQKEALEVKDLAKPVVEALKEREKKCNKCGQVKSVSVFYRKLKHPDGLTYSCKQCILIRNRKYREKNREKILKSGKIYRDRNRAYLRERAKQWRKENPDKYQAQLERDRQSRRDRVVEKRNYYRKTKLVFTDKNGRKITLYRLNKRDYPGYCELCGNSNRLLAYHHWDDKEPSKGLWLCPICHRVIHVYEDNGLFIVQKYLRLKKALNQKFKLEKQLRP